MSQIGIITPYDYRPARSRPLAPTGILGIVFHHTGGGHTDLEQSMWYLTRKDTIVSYHFLIDPDDGRVMQLVPITRGANHIGPRTKKGRPYNLANGLAVGNQDTIGIAFVGNSDRVSAAAISAAVELIGRIKAEIGYGIWVKAHSEIAQPQGRKVDPTAEVMMRIELSLLPRNP